MKRQIEYTPAFPKTVKHKKKRQMGYDKLPFGVPVRYLARPEDMEALKTGISALRFWDFRRGRLRDEPYEIIPGESKSWTERHHYKKQGQGGDDVPENLIELTHDEHMAVEAGRLVITPEMMEQLNMARMAERFGIEIIYPQGREAKEWRVARCSG